MHIHRKTEDSDCKVKASHCCRLFTLAAPEKPKAVQVVNGQRRRLGTRLLKSSVDIIQGLSKLEHIFSAERFSTPNPTVSARFLYFYHVPSSSQASDPPARSDLWCCVLFAHPSPRRTTRDLSSSSRSCPTCPLDQSNRRRSHSDRPDSENKTKFLAVRVQD